MTIYIHNPNLFVCQSLRSKLLISDNFSRKETGPILEFEDVNECGMVH